MHPNKERKSGRLQRETNRRWVLNVNGGELITHNVVDVSPTGLCFKAPKKAQFKKGQTLTINLRLETEAPDFECRGEVMWVKEAQETLNGTSHHLGIQFLNLSSQADEAIMRKINHSLLSHRRREIELGTRPRAAQPTKRKTDWLNPALGVLTAFVLLASLSAAVYFHNKHFGQDDLAYRIQKAAIWKKLHLSN